MTSFKIKKGRDLKIKGAPTADISNAAKSKYFAINPPDFQGMKFKLETSIGDDVKIGSTFCAMLKIPISKGFRG